MNGIFWVVANSSVSTNLTLVLITGHNDESTIRHTSRSRLRNSESSQTFEQCSCTREHVDASALLWDFWVPTWHTHDAFAASLSQCVECFRRKYSVKPKVRVTLVSLIFQQLRSLGNIDIRNRSGWPARKCFFRSLACYRL